MDEGKLHGVAQPEEATEEKKGRAKVTANVVLCEVKDDGGPEARASVAYGGIIKINGYTVWPRKNGKGHFVMPPQNPLAQHGDTFSDVVYGTNKSLRLQIEDAVLAAYTEALNNKMKYTVNIHAYKMPHSSDLATADVIFNDEFVVKGFSIYRNKEDSELLVGMPRNDFLIDGEWHKGNYTIEAIRYGLIPDLKKEILAEYNSELEKNNFNEDYIQQSDSSPVTYKPTSEEAERTGKDAEEGSEIGQ